MNIEKECLDQFCGLEHHNRLWSLRWGSDHRYRLSDIEEVGEELAETGFGSPAMERKQHIPSVSPSLSSSNNSNSGSLARESQHQRFIVPEPPSYPPSSNSISKNLRERQHQHQRHLPPAAPILPHSSNSSTENKTRKTGRGHDGRPPSVRTTPTDQPTDSLRCLSHHPDLPTKASRPSKPSSLETASSNWRRAESKAQELVLDTIKTQEPMLDLAKTHTNGVKSRRENRHQQDRHQHPPQVTKELIGLPTDFQHVAHVGFNNATHVTDDRLSHDSTKSNTCTLGEQQIMDSNTLNLSCDNWDDGDQQNDHHSSTNDDVDQEEVQWVNKGWSRSDSVDNPILSFPLPPAVLSKAMIGLPTDFEHILHIGRDTDDLELQKLMEMASLRQEQRPNWKSPDCVVGLEMVEGQSHGASPTTVKTSTASTTRATSSTTSASLSTRATSTIRATSSTRLPPPPPPPRKDMMGQPNHLQYAPHNRFNMSRQNYEHQQQQQQPPIMACMEEQEHTSDFKTHDLICDLVEGEREAEDEREEWEHRGASTNTTGDSPPPLPPPPDDLGKDVIGPPTNFKHVLHINHDTADQQLQQLTKEGRSRRRVNPLKTRKSLPNLYEGCEAPREDKDLQPQYGRHQGKVPPPRMRAPSPKLRKDMIGPPYNFQHVKHVGFNSTSTQGTTEEQLDDLSRMSRSDVETEESERQQQEPQWQERQQQEPKWQERQQQEPKWQERQQQEPKWQERQQQEPKWQERQQQEPKWQERQQQEPKWQERQQQEPKWQERQQQEPKWQERQQKEPKWQERQQQEPQWQERQQQKPKWQERQQQEPKWQERQQQEPKWQERQQQEPKWQERQQQEPKWQERHQQEPKWQERQQQEPKWQERQEQEPKWQERQQQEPKWQERQQQEPKWQERQQQEPQWQNQRWSTPHIVEVFPPFTPLSSALSKDMIGPPTNFQHVCHIDHDTIDWELNKKDEDDRSSRGFSSHHAQGNTQPARLRKVIGPPTNFQHVAHVGINTSWQAGDVRQ
ncbi:uncharacterized protein [Cherax quadricarinatus]|uniref:uncharacterized protein isoform X2 n=1 Tax=Cherax quadricarinatus TaxID=27406 RepID=UPI00387EB309